jgi:hypothetical protein
MKLKSLLLWLLLFPSILFAFDKECKIDEIKELQAPFLDFSVSIPNVYTYGIGQGTYSITYQPEDRQFVYGSYQMSGTGFIINNTIITAGHVVEPIRILVQTSKHIYASVYITNNKQRLIFIGDSEDNLVPVISEYIDTLYDVAILSPYSLVGITSITWAMPVQTAISDMSLIEGGDCIFTVVRKRDKEGNKLSWYEVKSGKVISPFPVGTSVQDKLNQNIFLFDIDVHPGDSGAPIFAFNNGSPIIIGIIQGKLSNTLLAYGTRIDLVMNEVYALGNMR